MLALDACAKCCVSFALGARGRAGPNPRDAGGLRWATSRYSLSIFKMSCGRAAIARNAAVILV